MYNNDIILVVEDDPTNRESAVRRINHTPQLRTGWQVQSIEKYTPGLIVESVVHQMLYPKVNRPAVVVLDLNLGNRMDDGLSVIRSLKHCFDGIWIIHSDTFFNDKRIREEALDLGVRFALRKNDRRLGEMAHALLGLAIGKRLIANFARSLMLDNSLLDYPHPTDLRELLLKLLRIGHDYNGSDDPVSWAEVEAAGEELKAHALASTRYAETRIKEMTAEVSRSSESYCVRDPGVLPNCMANFTTTMRLDVERAQKFLVEY